MADNSLDLGAYALERCGFHVFVFAGKSNVVDGVGGSRAGKGVGLTKEGLVLRRSVSMDACLLPVGQDQLLPPILCRTSTGGLCWINR